MSTTSGELRLRILRHLGAGAPQTVTKLWRALRLTEHQVNRLLLHHWFEQVGERGRKNLWALSPDGSRRLRELEDGDGTGGVGPP